MRKLTLLLGISVFLISCQEDKSEKVKTEEAKPVPQVQSEGKFKVVESEIMWKGYKPTGSHYGSVQLKEGYFSVKDNQLNGGKFVVDMTTIEDLDMPKDDPYNQKLVSHLKSDDFFYVEKFPVATFEITSVKPDEGDKFLIEGNLAIRDSVKSITFPAQVTIKDNELNFVSDTIKIDRTEFGIKYKSKKFFDNLKDKFINDLFDLSVKLKATKEK